MALRPSTLALRLSDEQRRVLTSWMEDPSVSKRQALRARIVLMAADGSGIQDISDELQCSAPTVRLWRQRFADAGLEGLEDLEGRGRPRTYQEELVEQVIRATKESPPPGMTNWTTRAMAAKFGIGRSTVQRIWQEHGLQPHLQTAGTAPTAPPAAAETEAILDPVDVAIAEVEELKVDVVPPFIAEPVAPEPAAPEPAVSEPVVTAPPAPVVAPPAAPSLLNAVHGFRAPSSEEQPGSTAVTPEPPAASPEPPPAPPREEPAAIPAFAVPLPEAAPPPAPPVPAPPQPAPAMASAEPLAPLSSSSDPAAWEKGRTIDGSPVTGVLMTMPDEQVKYELARAIGSGACGTVFLGYEPSRDRRVAIKQLSDQLLDPMFIERFKSEVPKLKQLNHPNCVAVFDFIDSPDRAYVISEYVDGASVKKIADWTGLLSAEQALGVVKQTMKGLQAAHELGLLHRDIKPSNLLVDLRGVVKISDFGQAVFATGPGSAGGLAEGTPAYMSPEQITGGTVDRRTDLYSAGVMLFELLAGRAPFVGKHHLDAMRMHLNEPVPDLRSINPALSERLQPLVGRAMAKDPAKRHQTAKQFLSELELVAVNAFGTGWEERSSLSDLVKSTVEGAPVEKRRVVAPVPVGVDASAALEMAPVSGKDRSSGKRGAAVPVTDKSLRDDARRRRRDVPERWKPEGEEEGSGVGRLAVAAMIAAVLVGGGGVFALTHGVFGGGKPVASVNGRSTASPGNNGLVIFSPSPSPDTSPSASPEPQPTPSVGLPGGVTPPPRPTPGSTPTKKPSPTPSSLPVITPTPTPTPPEPTPTPPPPSPTPSPDPSPTPTTSP